MMLCYGGDGGEWEVADVDIAALGGTWGEGNAIPMTGSRLQLECLRGW